VNNCREAGAVDADLAAGGSPLEATTGTSSPPASGAEAARHRADQRLRAVSSYLVSHPPTLLPLASQLRGLDPLFESSIRGSSMEPAIPSRSRLRVRVRGTEPSQVGDVVYYLADDGGYVVHRVVHRARNAAAGYLLTRGDNCLAPDPPLLPSRVLGTVVEVQTSDGWRPPEPACAGSPGYTRLLRAMSLGAMIALLWVCAPAASRLAVRLRRMEALGRRAARRLLRRHRRQRAH
jgi:hypothetical protein